VINRVLPLAAFLWKMVNGATFLSGKVRPIPVTQKRYRAVTINP